MDIKAARKIALDNLAKAEAERMTIGGDAVIDEFKELGSEVMDAPPFKLPNCDLCRKGFPLVDGVHTGTQALGMIPDTRCTAPDHAPPFKPIRTVGPLELDKPLHGERRFHVVEDNLVLITLDDSRAHYLVAAVNQHADLVREKQILLNGNAAFQHENSKLVRERDELRNHVAILQQEEEFTKAHCGPDASSIVHDLRKQIEELKSASEHEILVHAESHARSVREKDELRADFKRLEHALKGTVHRFLVDDSVQPMCWCREPPDEVHELQCTVARAALRASEPTVTK